MLPMGKMSTMDAPARTAWNTSLGVVAPITQTTPSRRAAAATSGCRNGVATNGILAFLASETALGSVTEPRPTRAPVLAATPRAMSRASGAVIEIWMV